MAMKHGSPQGPRAAVPAAVITGIVLAAALLGLTRSWIAVPFAAGLLVLLPLAAGWRSARGALAAEIEGERPVRWLEGRPRVTAVPAALDEELTGLGYRPAGCLEDGAAPEMRAAAIY